MIGWRAQIGLIIPANNTVIEPEFYRVVPSGVSVHSTRVIRRGLGEETLMDMPMQAIETADRLYPVDVIGYACLSTSFYKGVGWDEELRKKIEEAGKRPTTTASSAMLKGLRELGIENVCVASPFQTNMNDMLKRFLEGNGFRVVNTSTIDPPPSSDDVVRLPPSVAYKLAQEAFVREGDGIFICATDLRTIDILEALERDLKKPVISTNQALLWDLLKIANVNQPIEGFGSLLRHF